MDMSYFVANDEDPFAVGRGEKQGGKQGSYTGFWTQVGENITVLPAEDKLLSQMFRQFIRRAQTGTNNKDSDLSWVKMKNDQF